MTNKTTDAPFNMLDYLTTSAMIDAYVAEAYASGDSEYIAEALQTAAIARDRIKTAPQPTPDRGRPAACSAIKGAVVPLTRKPYFHRVRSDHEQGLKCASSKCSESL